MSHTKGPWKVGSWFNGRLAIIVADISDYSIVAELTGAKKNYEENANLIAAAPDLLEALENANELITQLLPGVRYIALQDYGFLNQVCLNNVAAIKKAKGE